MDLNYSAAFLLLNPKNDCKSKYNEEMRNNFYSCLEKSSDIQQSEMKRLP